MKGVIIGTITGVLVWLLIALALWVFFFGDLPPAFSHPPMTKEEKRMVRRAIQFHGDFPVTREGPKGRYFMHIKGKKIEL